VSFSSFPSSQQLFFSLSLSGLALSSRRANKNAQNSATVKTTSIFASIYETIVQESPALAM
jgi:hypothetical protein